MLKEEYWVLNNYFLKYWYLTIVVALSILSYISVFIPPTFFWPAVFASYAIPGVLILNLILLITVPFFKKRLIVFPFLSLLFGLPFMLITISFQSEKGPVKYDFSVLGFNTKNFLKRHSYNGYSQEMINWAAMDTSDIKCIQEYSTKSKWNPLDVAGQFTDNGYHKFEYFAEKDDPEKQQGLAIFSKYDILDSGNVWQSFGSMNAGIFIDVKLGQDTLRIYNVHLASMHLEINQYKHPKHYKSKLKRLISRLKNGAEERSYQIDKLIEHTGKCLYPYIVCGDFNETPYSYNYFRLKRHFTNAFEEAGNGFGFSFNSLLFFLRIDHHFYNDKIEAIDYRVDRSMKISDHFPTRAYYLIKK